MVKKSKGRHVHAPEACGYEKQNLQDKCLEHIRRVIRRRVTRRQCQRLNHFARAVAHTGIVTVYNILYLYLPCMQTL